MSSSRSSSLTTELLRSYYPHVYTVQDYMARALQSVNKGPSFLTHETDTIGYRAVLEQTFVGSHQAPPDAKFKPLPPMVHLRDVGDGYYVEGCV